MTQSNSFNSKWALWAIFALLASLLTATAPLSSSASSLTINGASITASPSGASGNGTLATPLVYPTSISYGVAVSWTFTGPATLTECRIAGGTTALTRVIEAATSSANACRLTGNIAADDVSGLVVLTLSWGQLAGETATVYTSFDKEYNYGSNPVTTPMILSGTSGMQIGSTISIGTPTVWKNSYLNSRPASSFYGYAFVSNGKCGEANTGYSRVYAGNNDWAFAVNGFQIPASATDVNNRLISDLTGYGIHFYINPTLNNMMTDKAGPYKVGESTFVACTHPNSFGNPGPGGGVGGRPSASSAPIKYAGPEFSDLSVKPVLNGSATTLSGRKLDQISSVTIGGKAAVLSNATDKSVNIGLPAGLAPGVYDLVVTTANHGKLTHMNAIRVREALVPTSLTKRGIGVFTGEEFKELTAFAKTQNQDMNTATCIVNSNSGGKSFMQARTLCDRIAMANPSIKKTRIETRSTVQSSAVFARVVFTSEQ